VSQKRSREGGRRLVPDRTTQKALDAIQRRQEKLDKSVADLEGASTQGWHDIVGMPRERGFGANQPTEGVISASPFTGWAFAINDWMTFQYHVPHDYVKGTKVYVHVHWLQDGTDTDPVKWQFDITAAKGHQQSAFDMTNYTTISVQQSYQGQHVHMVAEVSDADALRSEELEPDALVLVRVTRITNGGTDNTDNIYLLMSDIHYESNNNPTPQKQPDFYSTKVP
jgi:hypothetical protein